MATQWRGGQGWRTERMSRSLGWRRREEGRERERELPGASQSASRQTDTEQEGKQDMTMERKVKKLRQNIDEEKQFNLSYKS